MKTMLRNPVLAAMAVGLACLVSASSAEADFIDLRAMALADTAGGIAAGTNSVKASSSYAEYGTRYAWNVSNGSGMAWSTFPTGTAGTGATGNMWLTTANNVGHTGEAGTGMSNVWIAWDLGATYTISKIHIWNYNEWVSGFDHSGYYSFSYRGMKTVSLQTGDAAAFMGNGNGTWTNALTGVDLSSIGGNGTITYDLNGGVSGTGFDTYTGFDWTLPTPITTRYLRFNNIGTFGGAYGGSYAGLSEVVFFTSVPEPATMAFLAFGGLSMIGAAIRRRRTA
ncbi:MAG: DUF5000 domain-containing lipoprotein [Phycisphaerae bacterium]|nr:DUF5000 domain-containing lipoprotein [Phycisphaerae bacterium]